MRGRKKRRRRRRGRRRRASEEKGEASHGSYSADRTAARVISRARQIDSDRLRFERRLAGACVRACGGVRACISVYMCSRPQALSGGRKPGTRFVSSVGISQSDREESSRCRGEGAISRVARAE